MISNYSVKILLLKDTVHTNLGKIQLQRLCVGVVMKYIALHNGILMLHAK